MTATRLRCAAKRGCTLAIAFFVIGCGLWLFDPSRSPDWPAMLFGPLAVGALYGALVYFEGDL